MNINIYVIAEPCVGVKDGSCVDVCPVACIHTTPEAPQYYIDPDICIACEQCVLVCPVNAIYLDQELPPQWRQYAEINAAFFQANKPAPRAVSPERAREMIAAVEAYAAEAGLSVAAAIVDQAGRPIASGLTGGADAALMDQALNKACTAALTQLPTDQLGRAAPPPGLDGRYLPVGGGIPIVDGPWVLGAIGVAGSPGIQQDIQCCRAGLAVIGRVNH